MSKRVSISRDSIESALVLMGEAGRPTDGHIPARAAGLFEALEAVAALEDFTHRLGLMYARRCNVPMSEEEQRGADARERVIEKQAAAILEPFGLSLIVQSDPRGAALAIATPNTRRFNGMGGAESGWVL